MTDVALRGVSFVRTTNAARVKTWQGGHGSVRNVTFADIRVAAVGVPIVVDQFYCPASQHPALCDNSSDAVAIKGLVIDGISGWHTSGVAAMLHCADAAPCQVELRRLQLEPQRGCSNIVRCWSVDLVGRARPNSREKENLNHDRGAAPNYVSNPCQNGNEMHGFRFNVTRREGRRIARNFSCQHPP